MSIVIPADVPQDARRTFESNYAAITQGSSRLALLACDQKIEHLHDDFANHDLPLEARNPEHFFAIAEKGALKTMATHLGLIARYAASYSSIHYIAKLNGKTNLLPPKSRDPISALLYSVDDVCNLVQEGIPIRGVGITVYLGGEFEYCMLSQAAHAIHQAHRHGLVAIVWMYPRSQYITQENDPHLLAGAAGVANALGADFVKIKPPSGSVQSLQEVARAAGNTKVLVSGETLLEPEAFFKKLYTYLHEGLVAGSATGRNVWQRPLQSAIAMTHGIAALVCDNKPLEEALGIYRTFNQTQ